MFERYTERARRAVFFARYEASQVGTPVIEPEHLLLGLLREDKALMRRFLGRQTCEALLPEITERAWPGEPRARISTRVELPLGQETKRVLAYAYEEAEGLRQHHIGTAHMLLGLLRAERSLAAEILHEKGLSLPLARRALSGATELGGVMPVAESESGMETSGALNRAPRHVALGLERLLEEQGELLRGARVGLICNQASVNHDLTHAADLLRGARAFKLTTLFGPQHGIRGEQQDNMIESPHVTDEETGLPVYSLYSETREPTEEMLSEVDALVCDLQDVGCRIYTFIYTLANCMRAARRYGKRVIVCDRPNPIGGEAVAGNLLEAGQESFVGQYPLPTRHGMTVGELARMFNEHWGIGCELEVIEMRGWERALWFDETDLPWVMPSPNMPTLEAATVFPGTVHIEGTQLSEGRGTTRPFELIGAPYVKPAEYARELERIGLPGVRFRACSFMPTFQKHAGRACGGAQLHVTDRRAFEPVLTGIALIKVARDLYGDQFQWKEPPYEYEYERNPFDVIAGTKGLRRALERGDSLESIEASWQTGLELFLEQSAPYRLY